MKTFMRSSSDERPTADAIRDARVGAARRNPDWTELAETDLVRRARYLVHAETDELFTLHRGTVFATGSTTLIADRFPMFWYLDRDGDLVCLERVPGTWSERVARQAKRQRTRA